MFKKLILRLSIFLLAIITIAAILPSFINWDAYKVPLLQQISKHTPYVVTIDGQIKLALLPTPHLSVADVSIRNLEDDVKTKNTQPLVKVRQLSLALDFLPLLSKKISVRSVELIEPIIVINKQDGDAKKTASAEHDASKQSQSEVVNDNILSLDIARASIVNGLIIFNDPKTNKRTEIDSINVSGDFSFQNGFNMKAGANVFGMHLDGILKGSGFVGGLPHTCDIHLDTIIGSLVLSSTHKDGVFTIKASSDLIKVPMRFQVGPHIIDLYKGVKFSTVATLRDQIVSVNTIKVNVQDFNLTGKGVFDIEKTAGSFALSLTSTLLEADGTVGIDLSRSKTMITADLRLPKLDDKALRKIADTSEDTEKKSHSDVVSQITPNERWSKDQFNLNALQTVDADVRLAIETLSLSDIDASHVKLHFKLNNGIAVIKNMSANVFDGDATLTSTLDSKTGHLTVDGKLSKINVIKLPGVKGSALKKGTLNLAATITTKVTSVYDVINQLNGTGNAQVTNGIIESIDIKQFIADIKTTKDVGGLSKLKESLDRKADVAFNHVRGDVKFTNGVAHTDNFEIDLNEGTVASAGAIDLANWTVSLHSNLTIRDFKNIPNLSVNITGAIDHPNFDLDMAQLQKVLIQLAVNKLTNRTQDVAKKKINEQISNTVQDQVGNQVGDKLGGEVAKAVGKILPGLFG